jgi:hypothetical protein
VTPRAFVAELYLWQERADSWTFVNLPRSLSDEIDEVLTGPRRGFGSVRVRARVGGTTWETSVFPSKSASTYVLPVKRAVRRAEGVVPGDELEVEIEVLDPTA